MGVDTQAKCVVGKYFEDFDAALEFLVKNGKITEDQADEAQEYGDLSNTDVSMDYQTISCYSEEGGYLGVDIPKSLDIAELVQCIDSVKSELGEVDGLGIHNFTYWY